MHFFLDPIEKALGLGLIPLIHGDLAFDSSRGCGVISADRLASFLGVSFRASRVLFGCDVDGVYSRNPKVSPNAKLVEEVNRENAQSILRLLAHGRSSDATGGMLGKVREAIRVARTGRECYIFNLKRETALGEALRGKVSTGTRFPPWRGAR
jgi:isopentenyl phosphate kinase